MAVSCRLMKEGTVLEAVEIPLAANGQQARFIEEVFPRTDTSDFVGSVRCTAPEGEGMFTGIAVELDAGNQIFTTLPVVPVPKRDDVSGIDKGRDPVVQGLSRSSEGGSYPQGTKEARSALMYRLRRRVLLSGFYPQKGESLLPSVVGLGLFWVLVNLFTGA